MRFAAVFILALAAAPAFAQQAPQQDIDPEFSVPAPGTRGVQVPPPEGFYRNIPNAYDLLLRMGRFSSGGPIIFLEPCTRPEGSPPSDEERAAYAACITKYREELDRFLKKQREAERGFRLRPAQ
jgi:hypothetical protein